MSEIIKSGSASFNIQTPYELLETGAAGEKPLLVYLHGFKQNIATFKPLVQSLLSLEAYHLFVQAPYPLYDRNREKKVAEWGRAWYLYDGEQAQFLRSLEHTSQFLENVITNVSRDLSIKRTAMLGYSMGGYVAGYYGLSRSDRIDELIVVGSRIKTEAFEDQEHNVNHLNVLALHGQRDRSVKSVPQKRSCRTLSEWGADVLFQELEEGHKLTQSYLDKIEYWLAELGYG